MRVQKEGTGFSFPYEGLIDLQEGIALKTAPHLSVEVLEPSHFDKMSVAPALNVFSEELIKVPRSPSAMTTQTLRRCREPLWFCVWF